MARRRTEPRPARSRFPHPRGDGPARTRLTTVTPAISPPTWGWPAAERAVHRAEFDFPTHVGMARPTLSSDRGSLRFPHPRGDGPSRPSRVEEHPGISPPTWGWPAGGGIPLGFLLDFPTHVGMARFRAIRAAAGMRFPHPRGDGPSSARRSGRDGRISPPTWGWPAVFSFAAPHQLDFPTHVGMARLRTNTTTRRTRFPHPRGDGPKSILRTHKAMRISPPTWGWPVAGRRRRWL